MAAVNRISGTVKYKIDSECYYESSLRFLFLCFYLHLSPMDFISLHNELAHSALLHPLLLLVGSLRTVSTSVEVRVEENLYQGSCWLALKYSGIVRQHIPYAVSPSLARAGRPCPGIRRTLVFNPISNTSHRTKLRIERHP